MLDLLEEYGIFLGPPHIKKMKGSNLWELKILGKDNIRIFFTIENKNLIFLHGFSKKKQKTNPKEIKIALKRMFIIKKQ
jgi:phage-related protein